MKEFNSKKGDFIVEDDKLTIDEVKVTSDSDPDKIILKIVTTKKFDNHDVYRVDSFGYEVKDIATFDVKVSQNISYHVKAEEYFILNISDIEIFIYDYENNYGDNGFGEQEIQFLHDYIDKNYALENLIFLGKIYKKN